VTTHLASLSSFAQELVRNSGSRGPLVFEVPPDDRTAETSARTSSMIAALRRAKFLVRAPTNANGPDTLYVTPGTPGLDSITANAAFWTGFYARRPCKLPAVASSVRVVRVICDGTRCRLHTEQMVIAPRTAKRTSQHPPTEEHECLVRPRPVAHKIAQVVDRDVGLLSDVSHHRFQRRRVAVDVGYQRATHRSAVGYAWGMAVPAQSRLLTLKYTSGSIVPARSNGGERHGRWSVSGGGANHKDR